MNGWCFVRKVMYGGALLLLLVGCQKKPNPGQPGEGGPAPTLNAEAARPGAGQGGQTRPTPRTRRLNPSSDLRQIGLYYLTKANTGRPPSRLEDLADMKHDAPHLYQAIQDGAYVVQWDARGGTSASGAILAFERDAPTKGGVVLFLDGSTNTLTAEGFRAAPKAGTTP